MNHRGATRNDRRRYNRVEQQVTAEEEEEAAAADDATQLLAASNNNNRRPPTRRNNNNNNNRRQQYDRIASASDDDEEQEEASTTLDAAAEDATATSTAASVSTDTDTFVIDDDDEEEELKMSITILDFAQSRFEVKANPDWTVGRFKQAGAAVHKVAPARQRLIYRGKMLQDDTKSLQQVGLATSGIIVHLFPKPRVVITNSSSANNSQADACDADDDDDDNSVMDEEQGGGGARVPTIVMDAEEAERRSQILVLGSTDFIEAQNNVKLFSFMLLIISSIELLNLFSIAMGVPQQDNSSSSMGMPMDDYSAGGTPPTDDFFTGSNNNYTTSMNQHYGGAGGSDADAQRAAAAELITHWGPAQYVDTVVSLLGVYVALLGLKASTENTLRLARVYLIGLFGCGTLWLLYNFFFTAAIEHKIEEHKQEEHHAHNNNNSTDDYHDYSPPLTDADIYNQAFQVMMLPALVWIMCCLRAWQFQHLLYEAEAEATDRIQAQLRLAEQDDEEDNNNNNDAPDDDDDDDGRNNDNNNNNNTTEQQQPNAGDVVDHDEELALGSRTAVLT